MYALIVTLSTGIILVTNGIPTKRICEAIGSSNVKNIYECRKIEKHSTGYGTICARNGDKVSCKVQIREGMH